MGTPEALQWTELIRRRGGNYALDRRICASLEKLIER
jgi:hypothetical protein